MLKYLLLFIFISFSQCTGNFDYLTFSQQWPPAVCANGAKTCNIPHYVQSWVIHGIWPSSNSQNDPQNCDRNNRFDVNKIQDLLPELRTNWPNVFADSTDESFWKHEWTKHGTCAVSLPAISGEENYFSKALELHKNDNIFDFLEMKGITPSKTTVYKLEQINSILDKKVKLVCIDNSEYSLLKEIHICYDKNFNIIDCPSSSTQCGKQHPILYLPYKARGHSTFFYAAVAILILALVALVIAIIWLRHAHRRQQQFNYAGFN